MSGAGLFNWKRSPNPLTAGQEEADEPLPEARALPFGDLEEIESSELEQVAPAPVPALPPPEPKRAPQRPPAPQPAPAPPAAPPALPPSLPPSPPSFSPPAPPRPPAPKSAPVDVEAAITRLQEAERLFQTRVDAELEGLRNQYLRTLEEMALHGQQLQGALAERDRALAARDEEIARLRGALKKVISEAFEIVREKQ